MIKTIGSTVVFASAAVLIVGGLVSGMWWISLCGIGLVFALLAGV